jgi:hypothetical protein
MNKEVSIVLSSEKDDYRKIAQKWYGLTNEQMRGMDVHHNPARHEGGRNIPEHLYVYHNTLHSAVHESDLVLWSREAGKRGAETNRRNGTGLSDPKVREKALSKQRKPVEIICAETGETFRFPSIREAAESLNLDRRNLTSTCNGKQKTTKGYLAHFV